MTRYPKGGSGSQWTVKELQSIPKDWKGDTLNDGKNQNLSGEVRVSSTGAVSVRFKHGFKWEGKLTWHQCGTWPLAKLADIREQRDRARQLVKTGVNPNDQRRADRIDAQAKVEAAIAEESRRQTENLAFGEMFEAWLADAVIRQDDPEAVAEARFDQAAK
jgi:hypothetical protein